MHSGGVLTARILERNCAAGTSIWKCFSPTVWTMALNAIMLISEISMMVIKDCYIELDFLKLDYGCYFTLVFVHGCTCTVCWNVVVVYWWGSFPLSVSNPIFREKLICCLLLYKIEAKISHNHRLYRHVLHSVTAWEFLVWWLPVLFCCYTLLWLVFTLYLLLTCAPSVLLPPVFLCWCPWLIVPTVLRSCPYRGCSAASRAQLLNLTSLLKRQITT